MTHRFKQASVLLMALLMLFYGCGFKAEVLANTATENSPEITEPTAQTDPAFTGEIEDTKKKVPSLIPGNKRFWMQMALPPPRIPERWMLPATTFSGKPQAVGP